MLTEPFSAQGPVRSHAHAARLAIILCVIGFCAMPRPGFPEAGSPGAREHSGFRQAAAGYTYRFPHDHGAHDEFRTEWWYYTGHLSSENGRRFGYQLTFFRRGIEQARIKANPSRWTIRHLYLAHFALSDHGQARFRYAEKVSRAGLGKAGAEAGHLRVWIDRWIVETSSPEDARHHLKASAKDFSIDLVVTPETLIVVGDKEGGFGDLREGDRVIATYEVRPDTLWAKRVEVSPAALR